MADKYLKQKKEARNKRHKEKSCERKKQFTTREEALQQKGAKVYKCKFCGHWHRSLKMSNWIKKITKKIQ